MQKRCFDLCCAGLGLLLLSPLLLLIAVAVLVMDGRPVLFLQPRLGCGQQPFRIYKFRTLRAGRVTRTGRWLRATGLDELPQLVNVLRGEMSLVGPRALTAADVVRLGWGRRPARWAVRPGITGLAQLYAGRGARVSRLLDERYTERASLALDLRIIALSLAINLLGKRPVRAYLQRWRRGRRGRREDWSRFLRTLRARAQRPLPDLRPELAYLALPASLTRSLAAFQVGEASGGSVVEQVGRCRLAGVNGQYREAIRLFVAEEHRHGEILARAVRALGGEPLRGNWTETLFRHGRRLMGLRLKVLVLLAAEVIGICYYRLLASRLPPSPLRRALEEMAADEVDHLAFHCAFLRLHARGILRRLLFRALWRSVTGAALLLVAVDHWRALRELNISRRVVARRSLYLVAETERLVLGANSPVPERGLAEAHLY